MNATPQAAVIWKRRLKPRVLLRRPRVLCSLLAETLQLYRQVPALDPSARADALKRLWRIGTLNCTELDYLTIANRDLAPLVRFTDYCQQVIETFLLNLRIPVRLVSEAEYKDYLADPGVFAARQPAAKRAFTIEMAGLEHLQAPTGNSRPMMLLTWHGGAQTHNFLGDLHAQVPRLEVYSAYRELFTSCVAGHKIFFSIPLMDNPNLGLLQMAKFIEEGRSVLLHFDGIAGKRDMTCRLFGLRIHLGRGFIHIARHCKAVVLPVTACFLGKEKIRVEIGPPLFSDEELQTRTDEHLMDRTLRFFVDDLRKNAPAGVVISGHLAKLTECPTPR